MPKDQSPPTVPFDAARVAKAIRQRLQSLQRAGVTTIRSPGKSQTELSELEKQLAAIEQNGLPESEVAAPVDSVTQIETEITPSVQPESSVIVKQPLESATPSITLSTCLLYTSDAADE